MVALAHVFINCSMHKMAKRELARNIKSPLEDDGKVLVNLNNKAFLDDAG